VNRLTIRLPNTFDSFTWAYIKGVMDGDGDIDRSRTNPRLRLEVCSFGFAESFDSALRKVGLIPRWNQRDRVRTFNGYTFKNHFYVVRATCPNETVERMLSLKLSTLSLRIQWLIGFFQAEGGRRVLRYKGKNYVGNRWTITNRNQTFLQLVVSILLELGIKSGVYTRKNGISDVYVQRLPDIQALESLGMVKR